MTDLTPLQARRIALGAQGFARQRPANVGARQINAIIARLGLFQIDSVNVLVRAHYMPLFSRVGSYDRDLLHRAFGRTPRRLFEYWAHEAALVDVHLHPALRFRMSDGSAVWAKMRAAAEQHREIVDWVLDEVAQRGPLTARQIELDMPRDTGNWGWNWSLVKSILEYLFAQGLVTSARRNGQFERLYDLPSRVIPQAIADQPAMSSEDAHRHLIAFAGRAHGVGTLKCLRDYFRLQPIPARQAVADLVDAGELIPANIRGWRQPAYLHKDASIPRTVRARALLSPFDPLIFERTRTERLFNFRYRIEIYVPEPQRVHGYYVLPFLLGDQLVARVDLKADRSAGLLLVRSAWAEPHAPPGTARELAAELHEMAAWLGLGAVSAQEHGDLAADLRRALAEDDGGQ